MKYKCRVCKKRFELKAENKYIVRPRSGLVEAFSAPSEDKEAFDCPFCGCQNVVWFRLSAIQINESES